MKEYKVISQGVKLFKNGDAEFEKELNKHAREGWSVVTSAYNQNNAALKIILERDKNR
mgnify:CR=1 FL=1